MIVIYLHPSSLDIVDQLSLTNLAILIALNVQNIAFDTAASTCGFKRRLFYARLGFRLIMFPM